MEAPTALRSGQREVEAAGPSLAGSPWAAGLTASPTAPSCGLGSELAGQASPLFQVGEELAGHPDACREELAEQLGRGQAAARARCGPARLPVAGGPAGQPSSRPWRHQSSWTLVGLYLAVAP